jgi:polyhydroxybutyrate depolymerase
VRALLGPVAILCVAGIAACGNPGDAGGRTPGVGTTTVPALCRSDWPDGTATVTATVRGVDRSVRVHVPPSFTPDASAPLVLSFHGAGATAEEQATVSGLSGKADREGFVVAYPQAIRPASVWPFEPGDDGYRADSEFVDTLLAAFTGQRCVDRNRVLVTGFSNGGWLAQSLACRKADRVSAIAAVSPAALEEPCSPRRPVPLVVFHGVLDPVLAYGGGPVPGTEDVNVLPMERWVGGWADRDGCTGGPEERDRVGHVVVLAWTGCTEPVVLYRVEDGGHTWPGGPDLYPSLGHTNTDISATDVLWSFFVSNVPPSS